MSTAQKSGRPVDMFVLAHFTKLRKVNSSANKWIYQCNYCKKEVTHRETNCADHISEECTEVNQEFRVQALQRLSRGNTIDDKDILEVSDSTTTGRSLKRKKTNGGKYGLTSFMERELDEKTAEDIDLRLLRFIVHANIPFSAVENDFFQSFIHSLRPMYNSPSRFELAHYTLKSEAARIQLINIAQMKEETPGITLLCDGWEDVAGRSIYATVAIAAGEAPVVLNLTDMSGKRATADAIIKLLQTDLDRMGIDPNRISAICTDNPTTMAAVRRRWEQAHPSCITYPCRLHQLNTLLGKISAFPQIKVAIKKIMRIVVFFNRSHYWGGQLLLKAREYQVTKGLTLNTESRWYALVLMFLNAQAHYRPLRALVQSLDNDEHHQDAGQSKIPDDIINTIDRDFSLWELSRQFVRTCKPLVDSIGRLEARDANLADCMIELLHCAYHMKHLEKYVEDDDDFYAHAQKIFNNAFKTMNTDLHFLCLFLHPSYRRFAVLPAPLSRSFKEASRIALVYAKKWEWSAEAATLLKKDLDNYHRGREPFDGTSTDALEWWKDTLIGMKQSPLKCMAIVLLQLTPHAADVERLFSNLGAIHSPRRSRLGVTTMEHLGRLRSHYNAILNQEKPGKKRFHHRTNAKIGSITEEAIQSMEREFTMDTVLTMNGNEAESDAVAVADIETALDKLSIESVQSQVDPRNVLVENANVSVPVGIGGSSLSTTHIQVPGPNLPPTPDNFDRIDVNSAEPSHYFDFEELGKIIKGQSSLEEEEEYGETFHRSQAEGDDWSIDGVLASS